MRSPLVDIGLQPYVNVFGDSVIRLGSEYAELFTQEECETIVQDVQNLRLKVSMGEKLSLLEKLSITMLMEAH